MRQSRLAFALVLALVPATPALAQDQPRVVRELRFEGNRALDDVTLAAAIATSTSSAFARRWWLRWMGLGEKRYFDEVELRRDVVRLTLLYRASGYMNVVVDTLVRRTPRDVYVAFRIHEGEPVRVVRLDIAGVEGTLDGAALRRDLPLRVGDPFNRFLLLASADTVTARLKNRGHPYAQVLRHFDSDAAALRAEVELEALPGPRVRIGAVLIEGVQEIDSTTVRRLLSVRPGRPYRERDLFQSQRELYAMEVFRSVNVLLVDSLHPPVEGDSTVRVLVRVAEGPRHSVRVGAGYASLDCFRVQSAWAAHHFLGGGRSLTVAGRVSKLGVGYPSDAGLERTVCPELRGDPTSDTVNYSVGVTLVQPAFLSPGHRASLGVFAERRSEVQAYTRQSVGFNAAVTLNAQGRVPATIGYSYSVGRTSADRAVYCSVFRVCDAADQAFLANRRSFGAVSLTGVRDRTNSVLDPTRGSVVTAAVIHASRFAGSDRFYEFNRGELEVARYYPVGRYGTLGWRVRAGTILPQRITLSGQNARFVPPDQRFYAGGPHSVRGYGRNELGPRVYVTSDTTTFTVRGSDTVYADLRTAPTGGNTTVVVNTELRVPAPLFGPRIRIGLFVDVGQVWDRGNELIPLEGLRVTPGLGLRFTTPLGPVRLDAAYNAYEREPGPLYYLDNTTNELILFRSSYGLRAPRDVLERIVFQFAVGQAF